MLFYIYASLAAAGILVLPSYGAWWQDKNDQDWWKCEPDGKRDWYGIPTIPMPVAYFFGAIMWPLVLAVIIGSLTTKLLALPGKTFVRLAKNREQNKKFLTEAEREVERLLSTSH